MRLERRLTTHRWLVPATVFGSLVFATFVTTLVLLASGQDPVSVFDDMIAAAITDPGAISATLVSATPLVFTGLAAAIAFRMRVWNIGGQGQLYVGAIAATAAGLLVGTHVPGFVGILAMVLAGCLAGALWAFVPGVLRARLNTNEILTSLMLNYVAGLLLVYLILDSKSWWRDTSSLSAASFPQGKTLDASTFWPTIGLGSVSIPLGLIFGVLVAVGLWVGLRSTTFGFRMRVIGNSPAAGRYAGMRTSAALIAVMVLSGALAGLGGASQVGDFNHTLDPTSLQQGALGYAGIVVAALALYNPLAVIASALLLGGLVNAGIRLGGADFPDGLVGMIQAIVLFSVLGGDVLSRYRVRLTSPRLRRRALRPARES